MISPEPYKIKMVEAIHPSTKQERLSWIRQAGYNLFNLTSDQVFIDLLTDSGTGAMSDRQWAALMGGDEAYAGSRSFKQLKDAVADIFGMEWFLPTHQGRAAENVLFSALVRADSVIPGNAHFDTTKGHIEYRHALAADCTIDEAYQPSLLHPFKGNADIKKIEAIIHEYGSERIPFIIMTLTCNTAGGQPVSMDNLRQVRQLADRYGIQILFDSARFAENAWFIQEREAGYADKSIQEIVREMFSYADMMTISAKKDGLVNIGGFIGMKSEELFRTCSTFNILFEGFNTYGGMAGRDMAALAKGLYEVTDHRYLSSRIGQVAMLGDLLDQAGVPVLKPVGGHAVFLDALGFYPQIPREEYPAQTLALELYKTGGIRAVEIGTILADRDPLTRENRFPKLELVRLAIPRRVYTSNHIRYIAEVVEEVWREREQQQHGYEIVTEAPIMRHFTVVLQPIS